MAMVDRLEEIAVLDEVDLATERVGEQQVALQLSSETLLMAMAAVEANLKETQQSLHTALHKARDAETVVTLLRARVLDLTQRVKERTESKETGEGVRQ